MDSNPTPDVPPGEEPYGCKGCGHTFGLTTSREIRLGSAVVMSRVVLTCPRCGKKRKWKPLNSTGPDVEANPDGR